MKIYDYANNIKEIELPNDKTIEHIFVMVLSGDEMGHVYFTDDSAVEFDSCDTRVTSYFDGYYVVSGDDVQKWISWEPSDDDITYSYSRQRAFSDV